MTTLSIENIIASHPFFAGLAAESLRLVAEKARLVELPAGEVIFHQGEAAERFYLIRTGRVALDVYAPRRGR
ncbi:MAG: cyclic nucleotide-binding domain-containing protein, partial [Acidobacteriota bacterium]